MSFVIGGVIGIIIGWFIPQPQWAKDLFSSIWRKIVTPPPPGP